MANRGVDKSRYMRRFGDVKVAETKTGHEYRVRDSGKIKGEYEKRNTALKKARSLRKMG